MNLSIYLLIIIQNHDSDICRDVYRVEDQVLLLPYAKDEMLQDLILLHLMIMRAWNLTFKGPKYNQINLDLESTVLNIVDLAAKIFALI